jgi:dTDP-glucose 4,6-dehydratase
MYASDLMICLWNLLIKGDLNSPYNVGSDHPISIKQLSEIIKKISKKTIEVKVIGTSINFENIDIYCPNTSKIKMLNLHQEIDIYESIAKTLNFNKH